jgi:hypothetical protein
MVESALSWPFANSRCPRKKENQVMKLLFFSADRTEIESVSNAFSQAGIDCETRKTRLRKALPPNSGDTELWIKHDGDAYKALLLCVEQGIGFAKRAPAIDHAIGYASWDRDESEMQDASDEQPEHRKAA